NGEWCVVIIDDWGSDDGTLFAVSMNFDNSILPVDTWSMSHTYNSNDMTWSGDGINPNSGGTATANPTTPGDQTYTFSVVDDFGCEYDTTLTVHVRNFDDALCCEYPTTSAGPDDHVCNNQYTFNATMATGNTGSWALISGPGTVTWANQNSPHAIVTVNGWGSYEFEWTEQNGGPTCIDQDRVIIEFYPVPTTTFTFDPIMCYGDTITLTYTGNMSATATFDWDFDGASVVSGTGIGPYEIYWSTAAMHSVGLTVSENGCTSPDTLVNIINPAELTHNLEVFDDPCFQSCEGRAEITVVGGTLPYDYSWGSPTNILPNLCAGDYSITVTDANGCTTAEDFTINEPPQLVINSITTTNLTCYQSLDGAISVDASGGTGNLLYLWSDMGYGPSDRTNLIAGDYCVTVEDENGCTVSQCVTLTQPDELLVTMSPNIAICQGQQTTIQAQGMGGTVPYTYLWDQGTGVYNVASSSLTLAPDTTTVFSVYVTDDHGCTSNISSMRVTVSPLMVIDTMLLRDNRCFGSCDGRAEIVMHGGLQPLQYSWGSPNHIYDGLCAGIYTVTVNDIIGCTVSEMFVIEQPTQLTYTSATEDATCYGYNDGEATIFVQGGVPPYSYLWPNGHDTETLVTTAGTYTVTVADDHDCKVYGTFTINQPTDIFVLPVGNRTICQSQSVTLGTQATGGSPYNGVGYDFHWTGSDGSVWNSNLYVVSPMVTTVYTLVVTDSHGCQSDPITSTVYVNPPLEILSVLTSNDTVCPGDPAIVHVDVQGGNGGPYLMTLQDGRVVPSPFTVRPDTTTMYYVTLEDMCGTPSVTDSILIIARPKPGNVFVAEDVEGCPPFAAYFTEGTPDYGQTYLWNFGDNGFSTEKNPIHIYTEPGTYNVSLEVEDFFGCKHEREIENMITIYPGPIALFEPSQEVVSFLAAEIEFINHSVDATDYYWFFGDGDSSLFVNPVHKFPTIGEYEVMLVAESSNDCTDTTTRIITVRNEFSFYFPTSFTPNGDGMNDCARPCGNGIDKSDFSLVIYDRWGNLVFQTDRFDPEAPCDACTAGSWDGTKNGSRIKGDEILPNGMYHWYAEFKDWNGIVFKEQGTITLIR
ncbi:MAG: PKD domain-containing protein, partial [Bacteroidales bacterium]|nr:PKD domain-containing protein [Bacteroidales bacterium]